MGVQGLWSIIQPTAQHTPLDELRGLRLAIDLAIWVVDDMQTQREAACVIPGRLHLRNLLFRTLHLLKLGARPIFIVDGEAPLLKVQTMMARAQLHPAKAKTAARAAAPAPPVDPDRVRKRARFRQLLRGDCCRLLDLLGVPHVESPGEAESMAALLSSRGVVDAVITNDGDAFLYGAVRVLRNFSMDSRDAHVDWFESARLAEQLGLSRDRLVALGLLLGCDYAPGGTPGVGPALALKFFRRLPPDADATNWLLEAAAGGRSADSDGCGVLRRFVSSSSTSTAAPAIVAEFLEANRAWPTVDPDRVAWRRPRTLELVRFCQDRLEWAEDYTIAKLLPLLLVWDETVANSAVAAGPRPHRILAERVRSGVPCYEVEFRKLEFDAWTVSEFYTLCVPRHPFGQLHSDLVSSFEQLRLQEKENKQKAKKLQQQQKKTQQKLQKQKRNPNSTEVKKIEDFFLSHPVPMPSQPEAVGRRRSILVDSLSDLFADISLASPAAKSEDLPQRDTKAEFVENCRQPFSHLFDFHHRQRLSMSHCHFRLDTSLLNDSPKVAASSLRDRAITDPLSGIHALGTRSGPRSESSFSPVLSLTSAFQHSTAVACAHASGPVSAHASRAVSAHASGPVSAHASVLVSAHASGHVSAHASGSVFDNASGPVSTLSLAPSSARQPLKSHLDDSFDKFETPPRLATRLQLLYNCSQSAALKAPFLE